jgi:hypothetical protein
VLQRAVQLAGDERTLARYLRVPMPELFMWLKGEEMPPQIVFLRAVDLVAEQSFGEEPVPPVLDDNPDERQSR